jgi:two-component system, NarL family, nitrate/nitrite response regulator NarL
LFSSVFINPPPAVYSLSAPHESANQRPRSARFLAVTRVPVDRATNTHGTVCVAALLQRDAPVIPRDIALVIVAGIRLYREGLATLLPSRPHLRLAGTAATADEALRVVTDRRPNLVIIDAGTPDAVAIAEYVRQLSAPTRMVVFGISEDDEATILAFAAAGVTGFVTRDGSLDDLAAAMDTVAHGEVASTPRIASILLRRIAYADRTERNLYDDSTTTLTLRERQILALIDLGLSNKEIAQRLSIEVSTVKNHVHHLLQKLHVTSRSAAAARLRTLPSKSEPAIKEH